MTPQRKEGDIDIENSGTQPKKIRAVPRAYIYTTRVCLADNESEGSSIYGSSAARSLASMIDDTELSQGVGYRDVEMEDAHFPRRRTLDGSHSKLSSTKGKVHVRSQHRPLQEIFEIGTYRDHQSNFCHSASAVRDLPVPYPMYSHVTPELVRRCPYMPPSSWKWLTDVDVQKEYRERFAFHHVVPSSEPGAPRTVTPLRRVQRMAEHPDSSGSDEHQSSYIAPVLEVIFCNSTVHAPNHLNRHVVEEISHELAVLGDAASERLFRHDLKHGGNPGCSSIALFNIQEMSTHLQSDDDILKLMSQCANCFGGVDMNMPNFNPAVNTEFTNTCMDTKRMRDVYVKQGHAFDDAPCSNSVGFLHPTLVEKICRARALDPAAADLSDNLTPKSRANKRDRPSQDGGADVADEGNAHNQHKFITCFLHIVPCVVRDTVGKRRVVLVEVLRISSRILGCDPAVALHQLIASSTSEDLQNPLIRVVRKMARCLEMNVDVNITDLFNSSNEENLVSIALDANIPLAFFNYLKHNNISCDEPSMFAADYMGMRIDVWDHQEVQLFRAGMHVTQVARRELYRIVLQNVLADIQTPRNAKLPIPTATHDFRMFYPGMHWRAIPTDVFEQSLMVTLRENVARGTRTDNDQIVSEIDAFNDLYGVEEADMKYIPVDGFPHLNGYAFRMNPVQQSKDKKGKASFSSRTDGDVVETDNHEVQPILYSSKQFRMFCENFCARQDICQDFVSADSPDTFDYNSMKQKTNELSIVESIFWKAMTVDEYSQHAKPNKAMLQVEAVRKHYGLEGPTLQSIIEETSRNSDVRTMWANLHYCVEQEISKFVYSANMSSMTHLKFCGRFLSEMKHYDTDTEFSTRLFRAHMPFVQQVRGLDAANDDSTAALVAVRSFEQLHTELNFTNAMNFRFMQLAVLSIWCDTGDGCYGFCLQLTDGGGSFRVFTAPVKPRGAFVATEYSAKTPGAGADTIFNILGEILNAFGRHESRDKSIREFFTANPVCNLYRTKTTFSMFRMCGISVDNNGCIVHGMSEHNSSYGTIGAFLELMKLQQNEEDKKKVMPTLESVLGQSGSTSRGVSEKMHSTTHHGAPLHVVKTNPLQIPLLASNMHREFCPPSVTEGSRVVGAMSGIMDNLGIITSQLNPHAAAVPHSAALHSFAQCERTFRDIICISTPIITANVTYFLIEHMTRMLSFMHRSTRVHRLLWNKHALPDMQVFKVRVVSLTQGLRRHTFTDVNRMLRNFSGSFETAAVGKWARNVVMCAMNRRLQMTTQDDGKLQTHLSGVLSDAYKTYVLVPVSVTVLLSALTLYLAVVVLDVNVMLVTCMHLYYMSMPQGCALHVLALAANGKLMDTSDAERDQYHAFCEFLCRKLFSDCVTQQCLLETLDHTNVRPVAEGRLASIQDARQYDVPSAANHNTTYLSSTFFAADPDLFPIEDNKRDSAGSKKQIIRQQLAAWYAEHQTLDSPGTKDFWKHAVEGTRLPQKESSADMNLQFRDPNSCYKWHLATHDNLDTAQGVVIAFLRLCKMQAGCSRRDLLERMLQPHFSKYPRDKRFFQSAVQSNSVDSRFWLESIIDKHSKNATNKMLSWCFRLNAAHTGLEVAVATDVLWVILGQALFTREWESVGAKQSVVVHNRNIANAAEVLTFLFMHTTLPIAYVPVNDGAVVLSEPTHALKHKNAAVRIPYHRALHFDTQPTGDSFLSAYRLLPKSYSVVNTHGHVPIAVLKPIATRNALSHAKVHVYQLSPYPPECTAHMLPYLQQLQDADEAFRAKTPMPKYADCTWPLSTRLLGRSITPENSMHLPVCLTHECLLEEVPCFTYHDGFTFVLAFKDGMFHVTPVQVLAEAPGYYNGVTFSALPLKALSAQFAPSALAYTIRQGLCMHKDELGHEYVYLDPPPNGDAPAPLAHDRPLPFVMCPIIRHDAFLLLSNSGDALESFGEQDNRTREQLAIGVVCRHAATGTYLHDGHYCLHSFHGDTNRAVQQCVDFTFAHRCMLMDGHVIYWRMTQTDYADLLRDIYVGTKNWHIQDRAFALDEGTSSDCIFLECFYTIAHQAPSELRDAKMQVMFFIKDKNAFGSDDAAAFYDVPMFDASCDLNVHIMPPEDDSLIVRHFVFQ